jgi:Zn-dependent protease with chaperone function
VTGPLLVTYLIVLLVVVPRFLRGASWTRRAPRLAISVWLASSISAVAVMILGGTLLIVPLLAIGHLLISLVVVCGVWPAPRSGLVPSSPVGDIAGAGLLVLIVARVWYATVAVGLRQRRVRRAQRASLRFVARRDLTLDVHVLDHPVPTAFCLPGPDGGQVFVSDGALRVLTPPQVAAVIEHERAHLRGHHYLLTVATAVLARAFPRLPLFAAASRETACLVEMAADDAATAHASPDTVACALLDLAGALPPGPPASALAMAGHSAPDRARRLLGPRRALSPAARLLGGVAVTALLLVPVAAPTVPAMIDHSAHCRPRLTNGAVVMVVARPAQRWSRRRP